MCKLNKGVKILFLVIMVIFFKSPLYSKTIKVKRSILDNTSSTFLYQTSDSLIIKEYKVIKNLYDNKKYADALGKALKYYEKIKNSRGIEIDRIREFNILIGDIFTRTNNYRRALNYYKNSLSSYLTNDKEKLNKIDNYFSDPLYAKNLLRLGAAYQRLRIKDSAVIFYKRMENLSSLNKEVLNLKAASYTNLSGIYREDSIYDKAEELALKAIDIHKNGNDMIMQSSGLNNLANIYLKKKNFDKAKSIYLEAIDLIDKDTSETAIRYKGDLYYNLAWAMRNLEDYEAYDYQEMSYDIMDGIRNVEIQTMIEQVNAVHNVDLAKREGDLKRQKAQRNTWILGISSFFIILLLVFLLNQYKLRQKNLGLELSKQELMQQQKLEKIRSESQVRILNATLDGKETERKQIAETLHDSVSALLSSANLHLQACKKQFNGATPVEVDKSQSIINEASQKIRDLSHTLVSSILLKFGLSYAIKDITEKFSNSQLTIDSETKYIKRYDQGFEIKLYNIIQEFVNNILKHSEASYAKITLVEKNKKLLLTIQDNGKGFDKTLIPEKDGLGINQIDARIQMMQGKFHIESGKGKGTVINIELPVFEKKLAFIS